MKKTTDIDRIYEHFRKGIEMPPDLKARFDRLSVARDLLFGVGTHHFKVQAVLPHLKGKRFKETGQYMSMMEMIKVVSHKFNISLSQARLDLLDAKQLFPFLDPVSRDFEKAWLINSIKKNIARAEAKGDGKVVAAEHKNLDSIFGFSKEQGEQQPPSLIINVLNYNPAQLGAKVESPMELDAKVQLMLEQDRVREEEFDETDWAEIVK